MYNITESTLVQQFGTILEMDSVSRKQGLLFKVIRAILFYFGKLIDVVLLLVVGIISFGACCMKNDNLMLVMRETYYRVKDSRLNNEEEVDVQSIDISFMDNATHGVKNFCKYFEYCIKSPDVKSSDFITQVIAILW